MRLLKIVLDCNNISAIHEFYAHKMGFPCLQNEAKITRFQIGYSELVFMYSENTPPPYHLAFHVSTAFLLNPPILDYVGGEMENKIFDFPNWGAKSRYFYDTAGNILEWIARPIWENQNKVMGIAEIGMVSPNALDFQTQLQTFCNIPPYPKQPQHSPTVAISGTDTGLIICVKQGRIWFPTTQASGYARTEVWFESEGKRGIWVNEG